MTAPAGLTDALVRSALAVVGQSIVVTDATGVVLSCNAAAERLYGYAAAEAVGANITTLMGLPANDPQHERLIGSLATGRSYVGEWTLRDRTGRELTVFVTTDPIVDASGAVTGMVAASHDVTEQIARRAAVEQLEQTFRARFEQVPLPQAVLSVDGTFRDVNDAFIELFGYRREEVVGTAVLALRHPSCAPLPGETIEKNFAGRDSRTWEGSLTHADGSPIPVLAHAARVHVPGQPDLLALFFQDLRALRAARETLTRREAFFAAVERRAADWCGVLNPDGVVTYVSPPFANAVGCDEERAVGRAAIEWVHPDDAEAVHAAFRRARRGRYAEATVTFRVRHANGSWRWVDYVFTDYIDDPDIGGVLANGRDVTERVEAEQRLRTSEKRFRSIAETAQEGIWAAALTGETTFANPKLSEILGRPADEIYATPVPDLIDPSGRARIRERFRQDRVVVPEQYDLAYAHPDGRTRMLHFSIGPIIDDGGQVLTLAMVTDVTEARAAEEQLRRQALYDDLTGLANRTLLRDRLSHAVARAGRQSDGSVAVLFADLDQFKFVNDSRGHVVGDELLRQVADRLKAAVRPGDTVARFGGDEFVIVAEDTDELAARELAARLLQCLSQPFMVDGQRVYVSASTGIAVTPPNCADDLLRFAGAAMYDAKRRGRGLVRVFDSSLTEGADARLRLSNDLHDALTRDALTVHYQPLVDLETGRVTDVEALARWTHPTLGPVSPAEFVAVAEAIGLSPALDEWVLRRVCKDIPRLRGLLGNASRVGVNICGRHLGDSDLVRRVERALTDAQVPGNALALEITETALVADPVRARDVVNRLRGHGIHVVIDDFGTGYSSLSYLSQLPVDALKVDRSFVDKMTDDADALAITASIIDLARSLRLSTVAEGVETQAQAALLHRLGCRQGQGFLWSTALPLDELETLVRGLPGAAFRAASGRPARRVPGRQSQAAVTAEHGLQEILRMHHMGASLATIAAALNAQGYRTPDGVHWHRNSVARVVTDAAYPKLFPPPLTAASVSPAIASRPTAVGSQA